mgnify:CR=1 FL=1
MSEKARANDKNYPHGWLRWLAVTALVAGGIVLNSVYGGMPILYRVVALIIVAAIALWIAVNTAQGSSIWEVVKSSQTEVRKVVWPTRQETNQTTLIVVVLVILMAFILWGLDSLLGWVASLIIG